MNTPTFRGDEGDVLIVDPVDKGVLTEIKMSKMFSILMLECCVEFLFIGEAKLKLFLLVRQEELFEAFETTFRNARKFEKN